MQDSKLYIYFALLFCVLTLSACTNDDPGDTVAKDDESRSVIANFQLQIDNGSIASSRATGELPGDNTTEENKIRTLTIFVVDLKDNGDLDWTWVKHVSILAPPVANPYIAEASVQTNTGKKHVYVGANMSTAQINSFCANRGRYTSSGNTYAKVVNDFGASDNLPTVNPGIVMFGQMIDKATLSSVIEIYGGDDIYTNVELSRIVSKVALTYTAVPAGNKHVQLANDVANDVGGFIDADSVYFMLNATSKSVNFIPDSVPRYKMSDYIVYNTDPNYQTLYHYKKDPTFDFMFYSPQGKVDAYPTATIKLPIEYDAGEDNPYRQGLEIYDSAAGIDQKHYPNALYCLENTVNGSGFESYQDEMYELRKGINTHVVVSAKFVPGKIYHVNDAEDDIELLPIVDHAGLFAITDNDVENGPYTFYAVIREPITVPALYDYYTYDAKAFLEQGSNPPPFITYKGGYGYYSTFVTQDPLAEDADYNLERNNYYVLNVKEFTPPGAVYPQQLYMLVNSQTIKWDVQTPIVIPLD